MVLSLEYYKNLGCRDSALVNKKMKRWCPLLSSFKVLNDKYTVKFMTNLWPMLIDVYTCLLKY